MAKRTHILHTAQLKNNCPTCFGNDGLEFTFTQEENENSFRTKPSQEIEQILYCHNCITYIYPVDWTEDIERVHDYNRKLAETKRHHLKIKPLTYILILIGISIVAAAVYFALQHYNNTFSEIARAVS